MAALEYHRKTDAEIQQLAIDFLAGTLVTSHGLSDRETRSTFMLLNFAKAETLEALADMIGERGFLYGYDSRKGIAVNGRPVLWAVYVLDSEAADRFAARVSALKPREVAPVDAPSRTSRQLTVEIYWHPDAGQWHYRIVEPGITRSGWCDAAEHASDSEIIDSVRFYEILGHAELLVQRVMWSRPRVGA